MAISRSVLDDWIFRKINQNSLEGWQLFQLRETISHCRVNSPYYKKTLAGLPLPSSLDEFTSYPFTSGDILREYGPQMVCVSQADISRVVTLNTSGTSQNPKRLFFTKEDQELTIDFFHHGMRELTKPGQAVIVLLPYKQKGSVGDLLIQGLTRLGTNPVGYGIMADIEHCVEFIRKQNVVCAVGIPVQLLALASYCRLRRIQLPLENILLSTDSLPNAVRKRIEEDLKCRVFNHFGMTECGLGGALECQAHTGMHIRENDLYAEIIEPSGNRPLPKGQWGELVITTLTRKGMPLIRYRTGDSARLLPGTCKCQSSLKRLEHGGRLESPFLLQADEILFSLPEVIDYECVWCEKSQTYRITLLCLEGCTAPRDNELREAEEKLSAHDGHVIFSCRKIPASALPYTGKRTILRI